MKRIATIFVAAASFVAISTVGQAQPVDIGKREYTNNCAVCHGTSGRGDGPAAEFLITRPTNLASIAKRNGGVFPFARVYAVIDGTQETKGHGTREMPIWGSEFSAKAWKDMYFLGTEGVDVSIVQGRIVALIGYIHGLQSP